jgi:hypothetical protein
MIAEGASAMTPIVLTAGQVLIGTTSSDPVGATLTAGTNISITSATGAITINSTASGGGNWVKIATGSLGSNSITFSSLTSAYKTYKVILSGVKLSGADYIVGQLNGVANVYSYGAIKMDSNVTPTVTPAYLSGNGQMTFFGVSAVDASTLHISEITISELNSYQATSTLSDPTNGRVVMYQIGGYAAPLGPISSINLYTYGGSVTFTSGSVILYGLN